MSLPVLVGFVPPNSGAAVYWQWAGDHAARYWLGLWVGSQPWARGLPFGTMIINVSGSFILGVASVLFLERLPLEYRTWYFDSGVRLQ